MLTRTKRLNKSKKEESVKCLYCTKSLCDCDENDEDYEPKTQESSSESEYESMDEGDESMDEGDESMGENCYVSLGTNDTSAEGGSEEEGEGGSDEEFDELTDEQLNVLEGLLLNNMKKFKSIDQLSLENKDGVCKGEGEDNDEFKELKTQLVGIHEKIKENEPTINSILKANIREKDRQYMIELYEIYLSTMPFTEEHLTMKLQLKKTLKIYEKDYKVYSESPLDEKYVSDMKNLKENLISTNSEQAIKVKIHNLQTTIENKSIIYEKYRELKYTERTDENYAKLSKWLNSVTELPYDNTYSGIDMKNKKKICKYLTSVRKVLDSELYGMNDIKEKLMLEVHSRITNPENTGSSIGLVGNPGCGKCLGINTPVLMYPNGVKMVQDILTGDKIMGDDCKPRHILSVCRGRETMYRIEQSKGDPYIVNESHILSLRLCKNPLINEIDGVVTIINYESIEKIKIDKDKYCTTTFYILANSHVDKSLKKGECIDISVRDYLTRDREWRECFKGYKTLLDYDSDVNVDFIKNFVMKFDSENDEIPQSIKYSRFNIRNMFTILMESTFKGILFTPRRAGGTTTFTHHSKKVTEDIKFIYRSLGYDVKDEGGGGCLNISSMWGVNKLYNNDIDVVKLEEDDYYGFEIDGNKRFLLGDCTVTHNTAIAKALSKALSVPFSQISFGGIENTSYLKGHDYTYIGSQYGEITRCMKQLGCKNGIMFFDEYEKSADNKNISSLLLHVTDPIQNHSFKDSYLCGVSQDLSNIWFIYSMNNVPNDSALKDRINLVTVKDYTIEDKVKICINFFIPTFMKENKIKNNDIIFTEEIVKYLINRVSNSEKGVRQIRFHIKDIISKTNYLFTFKGSQELLDKEKPSFYVKVTKPFNITTDIIDIFTKSSTKDTSPYSMMYT